MPRDNFSPQKNEEFLRHVPSEFHSLGPCYFCAENATCKKSPLPRVGQINCHAFMIKLDGNGLACSSMKLYTYRVQLLIGDSNQNEKKKFSLNKDFVADWQILIQ